MSNGRYHKVVRTIVENVQFIEAIATGLKITEWEVMIKKLVLLRYFTYLVQCRLQTHVDARPNVECLPFYLEIFNLAACILSTILHHLGLMYNYHKEVVAIVKI
ncbi:hypothetical protein FRX31_021231 [Thalictrum thalictroides]|uniref:Uncharacterized protein n=1 Tax=Thalictrum thalictroides TaxID=46969 RepID=A0A7J6VVR0_THATH|nr:hypothetical protein FRX31_021231 [Thalictrum thalictroides]